LDSVGPEQTNGSVICYMLTEELGPPLSVSRGKKGVGCQG
jgi:hypothetical protein